MGSGQKTDNQLWNVQVSIAKGAAKMSQPSLAKLHHEVLEELGKPPSQELIDYFLTLIDIPEKEVQAYYRYIGKEKGNFNRDNREAAPDDLIKKIAHGDAPSVLKFRQAYVQLYKADPSEEIIKCFLREAQGTAKTSVEKGENQLHLNYADSVARSPQPTVLKLRKGFINQFGFPPSEEITKYFLKAILDSPTVGEDSEELEAKINFAQTVAKGLISTVLQFRQAYKKVYGEQPTPEIIDVFIKSLPRN